MQLAPDADNIDSRAGAAFDGCTFVLVTVRTRRRWKW